MRMHETVEIFSVTVIAVVSNFTFLNVCYTYVSDIRVDWATNDIRSLISYVLQDKRILRSHGYSLKGQRAKVKRRYSPWGPRITAIPVISYNEGLLDVRLYERHDNGETFLDFVNDVLTLYLLPFNGYNTRSIVILGKVSFQQIFQQLPTVPHRLYLILNFPTILADNAAIHHTREVFDAINATRAPLNYIFATLFTRLDALRGAIFTVQKLYSTGRHSLARFTGSKIDGPRFISSSDRWKHSKLYSTRRIRIRMLTIMNNK